MDCVNHPGVSVSAYCQNCGKPLCAACVRRGPAGQILCEPCFAAWQNAQHAPFMPPHTGVPNPGTAAVLGIIPGVGAMYNGQFFKGFIHVIIFAVLVSMSDYYPIFGLFIAAWIIYQSFEAHQTAKARRDGQPVPDPFGLNELGNWFQTAFHNEYRRAHTPPPYTNPYQGPAAGGYQTPNPWQAGYQPPPFAGPPPSAEYTPGVPPIPPLPPMPPMYWRRREPIAAIVLIALGLLFLAGQLDWFSVRIFEFTWPLLLIALGAWLIVRRMQDYAPPPQPPGTAQPPAQPSVQPPSQAESEESADRRREIL
jgi:hypothetical protein